MNFGHHQTPDKEINGISLYFSGDIAVIVMDRGENKIDQDFLDAYKFLLDEVENNASCKGLITTGKGKFYCNGLDLNWISKQTDATLEKFFTEMPAFIHRLILYPLPTLAAINGHAFAAGALMAFAHDLRVMRTNKGWIALNETRFGGRFSGSYHAFLRVKLGEGKNLSDIVLLAQPLTAEDAFKRGVVHAAVSENRLLTESAKVLKSFYGTTGYPRASLVKMKQDVYKEYFERAETIGPEVLARKISDFRRISSEKIKSKI